MIALQTYEKPRWIEERRIINKTLEVSIGGTVFYFDIPDNPMVYVSQSNGILYINGSSYWDSELYMFKDLRDEFMYQVLNLAKLLKKTITEINDELIEINTQRHIEKRKFYIRFDNTEIGFYYNIYYPDGLRNGIIEIIPYYKQHNN
ncbi:hypothetical protein [Saccharolobus caldissimus]|uniref:Uncharacterized protein n=1 Tax=Saccharolobus caldissimus TaxID=1702097 RepID=A0AAQ4CUR0_9CREN|nr:hypothetical protein [Saccharolobus caldissimus]BDB99541.1 hypothetical protein SACC_25580 [Saccharolobus caldissimus]